MRSPTLAQVGERVAVALQPAPVDAHQAVEVDADRARGGDVRVLLAQQAGGRVARVREQRLAGGAQLLVDAVEVGEPQERLAAHLQPVGRRIRPQLRRHAADGPHVGGHVLADLAVAAGGAAREPSLLVDDGEGDAVDLRLADVAGLAAEPLDDAIAPGGQLLVVERVVEGEQRRRVPDGREQRRDRDAAHALGRRIGRQQLGVLLLERVELAHQLVEVGVRDLGRVEHVVAVGVVIDLRAQLVDAAFRLGELGLRLVVHARGCTTPCAPVKRDPRPLNQAAKPNPAREAR